MPSSSFSTSWFLTGPTASGKSAIGIELARRLRAEIVSMDSMALYKRMDIGTAKPTFEERQAVPHHLVDCIEPWEEYSLSQYIAAAEKCVADIAGRGKPALFVGGTPLYLKGLLRGIFEGPAADEELRRNLQKEAKRHEPIWLHEELKKVDPTAAARLHPNDERRLIRALEVFQTTGKPISEWQKQFDTGRTAEECKVFVLDWPRAELHERIDRRVEEMFERGLVEEVRGLVGQISNLSTETHKDIPSISRLDGESPLEVESVGDSFDAGATGNCVPTQEHGNEGIGQVGNLPHDLSKTARQGVGYREVIEHLEGQHSLEETIELVKIHTRQLAKRQSTWFRSLSECRFIELSGKFEPSEIVDKIMKAGSI
jgi:tRNA dimethylallyltransferase